MNPTAHGSPLKAHRLETGVVQVGDDWPGIFLRGTDAEALAIRLEHAKIVVPADMRLRQRLDDAARLLGSCRANASGYAEAAAQAVHPEAIATTAKLAALLRARIQRRIEANDWDDSIPQLATDSGRHNSALLELLDTELALHPCRALQGAGSSEVSQKAASRLLDGVEHSEFPEVQR